jgi:hypothetical protein
MFARRITLVLTTLFVSAILAPAVLAAAPKPAAKKVDDVFTPSHIKRAIVTFDDLKGMMVNVRQADGSPLTVVAMNPQLVLLKNQRVGKPKDFKKGDKIIIYYNIPADPNNPKVLWAFMDPASEVVLAEMRAKPVAATFKSFDPASRKLTVQTSGGTKTYTMVAPPMAVREMDGATLGKPDTKEKRGYAPGDKLLLVMTANRKQVRLALDKFSYDRFYAGLKNFPIPPMNKIGK